MQPLTTREEVELRLGRPLTPEEDARFDVIVHDVSAYLYVVAPRIPQDPPVPGPVTAVASQLTINQLATDPETIAQAGAVMMESLGGYSAQYRSPDDSGLGVNSVQYQMLRPWTKPRIGSYKVDPVTAYVSGAG